MPLLLDSPTLEDILSMGAAIHKESECHVAVKTDEIRLRAQSEDRTIYFEYSLPRSSPHVTGDAEPDSFWIKLDLISRFLRATGGDEVRITLPSETPDRTPIFEPEQLTYQAPSLITAYGHRLPDVPASDIATTFSIHHGEFAKAITAANLIGGEVQLQINPETSLVEFAAADPGGDDFIYVVQPEQVKQIHDSTIWLTIPIDILRDLKQKIPPTTLVTIRITPHYVQYTTKFPTADSTLTLYIAERLGAIPDGKVP